MSVLSRQYESKFKLHRRLLHQVIYAKAALTYRQRQPQKAYDPLTRLLDDSTRHEQFTTCVLIQFITRPRNLHDRVFNL